MIHPNNTLYVCWFSSGYKDKLIYVYWEIVLNKYILKYVVIAGYDFRIGIDG